MPQLEIGDGALHGCPISLVLLSAITTGIEQLDIGIHIWQDKIQ